MPPEASSATAPAEREAYAALSLGRERPRRPQTDVVVAAVGDKPAASRRADVSRPEILGTAAQDANAIFTLDSAAIYRGASVAAEAILNPLPDVPVHVV